VLLISEQQKKQPQIRLKKIIIMKQLVKIVTLLVCILSYSYINAQFAITYNSTMNPQDVVNNVLIGEGTTASNIQFKNGLTAGDIHTTSVASNLKTFTATGSFPFSSGVFISTNGPGLGFWNTTPIDNDLQALLSSGSVTNGGVLEFDFIATGDTLKFNYMFASSEYSSYTCSSFNDVFGFFLSGPGIAGPYSNGAINIATIPGSNNVPVGINSVNCGCKGTPSNCLAVNPNYVADAVYFTTQYNTYSNAIGGISQFNGGTVALPATASLTCGETYHIKMAIANVEDEGWHSGVYLEGESFSTGSLKIDPYIKTSETSSDSTLYEGCNAAATFTFYRTMGGCFEDNDSLTAWIEWGGVAQPGIDYTGAVDSIVLAPGIDSATITISAIEDNIVEGIESLIVTIKSLTSPNSTDTTTRVYTIYIDDRPLMQLNAHDTIFYCLQHDVEVKGTLTGWFPPYTYTWKTLEGTIIDNIIGTDTSLTVINPTITENGVYEYILTVTDACEYDATDTAKLVMSQTLHIDSIHVYKLASCEPTGFAGVLNTPYGAHPKDSTDTEYKIAVGFKWTVAHDSTLTFKDRNSLQDVSGGWYYLEMTDSIANCTIYDSVYIDTENVPVALIAPSATSGCAPLEVTFNNNSKESTSYSWDFGNGDIVNTNGKEAIVRTFPDSTITYEVQLVASNGDAECNDTLRIAIQPLWCPIPTATPPNVVNFHPYSPNNKYFIHTENASTIDMIILNRWGSVVYEGSGTQNAPPVWDGRNNAKEFVADGVYFVNYTVTGIMGDVIKGNEFITVIR